MMNCTELNWHVLLVLYVDVSTFEKVALTDYTIYTRSINNNTEYYPFGSSGIEAEFFQSLKRWIFRFLDSRHHEVSSSTNTSEYSGLTLTFCSLSKTLMTSNSCRPFYSWCTHSYVLGSFRKQEMLAFCSVRLFTFWMDAQTPGKQAHYMIWLSAYWHRLYTRNEEHYKYITDVHMPREWRERYVLTEKNMFVMNTKIQILYIFDLIFDLRLRVRMSKLANTWKVVTEK